MLSNIGKKRKLATGILSAALSVTLISPASAVIPDGAPVGTQDFVSNGKSTMIFGSGSDTTYPMHQALSVIFNRAPGCLLQTPISADQRFDMECNTALNAIAGKGPGYANYDRDQVADYYFIGSGGGRNHVDRWNQGTIGAVQADYFRSSSSGAPTDGRSIAFARDALAAFTFDTVSISGSPVDSPGKQVASLTAQQVKDIWQGNTKCWASIDKTLSPIYNTAAWAPFTATNSQTAVLSESLWLTAAAAAAGPNYKTSDAYKACVPMAVYTVPQTSGTAQAWNTLAAGGTSSSVKSEGFLTKEDPFTGLIFANDEKLQRLIPENNASPIANRLATPSINTDLTTNAIYFYSVGKYTTALGGLDGSGNPKLTGNSTKQTGFTDRLLNAQRDGGATVLATAVNIASTTTATNYLYARSLFFGFQYPNQATRNYLDPINGFLCSTKTDSMTDPINSFNVRDQIEQAILDAGFFPFSVGAAVAGLTGDSYCRQATPVEDAVSPTAGFEINQSTAGATDRKPIFTVTFNELVSGVTADTVGLREFDGTTLVGDKIAATLVCTNARQAVIPCLAKTSSSNYDRSPLEYVKKVSVQSVSTLAAGKSFKAFALGRTGAGLSAIVEIQDRSGLSDWPIIDGNPLVDAASTVFAVTALSTQTLPDVASTVKAGNTISFSNVTSAGLDIAATSSTPDFCTVSVGGGDYVVTGVAQGDCKISLEQAGNDNVAAIPATEISITVAAADSKETQTLPTVTASVVAGSSFSFSRFTEADLPITAESSTPAVCTVSRSDNNYVVAGVSGGTCTISLAQAGDATYAAIPATEINITVSKASQTAPTVASNVVIGKKILFKKITNRGLTMTVSTSTPTLCSVKAVGSNFVVTGIKAGSCRITLAQAGNDAVSALPSAVKTIAVKRK